MGSSGPSFVIESAQRPADAGRRRQSLSPVPWDRLDSRELIQRAREVLHRHLCHGGGGGSNGGPGDPLGVVLPLARGWGRVVFEPPLLLPGEQFLPLELIHPSRRAAAPGGRRRSAEAGS